MERRDLSEDDPEVYKALKKEIQRQESESLEIIREVVKNPENEALKDEVHVEVSKRLEDFELYEGTNVSY